MINKKNIILTSHLIFLLLTILSIVFYLSRILNFDTSFQLFKIIYTKTFNIEAQRFSTVFTQILPIIGLKIGLPLKYILLLYSSSFIIIYYIAFLLNNYVFKNFNAAILVVAVVLLGVINNFFYIVTETHQALVYSALFFGWLTKKIEVNKILDLFISVFLVFFAFFAHPVSFFTLSFIIIFDIIQHKKWKSVLNYLIFAIIIGLVILKKYMVDDNSYEGNLFSQLGNSGFVIKNLFSIYPFKYFIRHLTNNYLVFIILFAFNSYFYISQKKIFNFILINSVIVGFFLITVIIYYLGDADCQMEKDFMPLSLMFSIPFLTNIENLNLRIHKIAYLVFFCFVFFHFYQIIKYNKYFEEKIVAQKDMIASAHQNKSQKNIIFSKDLDPHIYVAWPLSTEILFLSSLNSPDSAVTFFPINNNDLLQNIDLTDNNLFLLTDFYLTINTLNFDKNYFNLNGKYIYYNDSTNLKNNLFCDAEIVNKNKTNFINNNNSFKNANTQSMERSYSGTYSSKLTKELPFGFTIELFNLASKNIYVSVWRYSQDNDGLLVVSGKNSDDFYISTFEPTKIDSINGWQLLELNLKIPQKLENSSILIYTWNNTENEVFFDDLKIKRNLLATFQVLQAIALKKVHFVATEINK